MSTKAKEKFSVEWVDGHREPQCLPDLRFPDGVDIDVSAGKPACLVMLPHPAKRCGHYVIRCGTCGTSVAVTTAGRFDDPKSVRIPCSQ